MRRTHPQGLFTAEGSDEEKTCELLVGDIVMVSAACLFFQPSSFGKKVKWICDAFPVHLVMWRWHP